jgi:predicted lipid-binding transport protein (Tim44 family)
MTLPMRAICVLRTAIWALALAGLLLPAGAALARPGVTTPLSRPGTAPAAPGTAANRDVYAMAQPRAFVPPVAVPVAAARPSFLAGLVTGLSVAGLAAVAVGQSPLHGLDGSFAGFLGLSLQVMLALVLAVLAFQFLRRLPRIAVPGLHSPLALGFAAGAPGFSDRLGPRFAPRGSGSAAPGPAAPVLSSADFLGFERALKEINAAWSRQDICGMQGMCTPEMVQYFADDLARLASRGLRNRTSDVVLEQGDLAEAWREGERDYASVAMRFSLVDCTRDARTNRVMTGDPVKRIQVTEVWTFTRVRSGAWVLSAVQSVN